MNNSNSVNLSDAARKLLNQISLLLVGGETYSEENILSYAHAVRGMKLPDGRLIHNIADQEFNSVIRQLHERYFIGMGIGSLVASECEPWLQARKKDIDPFYWDRYKVSLIGKNWSPRVVAALDTVTDDILDLLGDPTQDFAWRRRGLVMGDVQSGKTSNYTGLICKAADAGYKLIILLTGTLESLRRQTQERLDADFVGFESANIFGIDPARREISAQLRNKARSPGVFTSTESDFKSKQVNVLGLKLRDYKEPTLFVLKKNKSVLETLTDWLLRHNTTGRGEINLPLLLIDDEADNASINTNLKEATAINVCIRNLLKIFPRSSYVGFTATPFANVFINPETVDEMIGEDIFPKDFIYSLDAPSNYIGAHSIFGDDSEFDCLKHIEDADAIFPKGQKQNSKINSIPDSMKDAIYCFFVASAIMDLRKNESHHRSMLINVSHFTSIQEQVLELVDELVLKIKRSLSLFGALPLQEALRDPQLLKMHEIYESEYSGCGFAWQEILDGMVNPPVQIIARTVNQKSGTAGLNYKLYEKTGLRIIAVGGNSLSRGLTLERLCVSYFFRGTLMYDALLQMGRWFGYRSGYEDIFRIWISSESANWYGHIAEATNELRGEIVRMQKAMLRPIDFGLRVRTHQDSLLITARNKMRDTKNVVGKMAVSGEMIETARLLYSNSENAANLKAAKIFISEIKNRNSSVETDSEFIKPYPFWRGVNKDLIIQFLRRFNSHPLNLKFQSLALADYIENSGNEKLMTWDVAVPKGDELEIEFIPGIMVSPRGRKVLVEKQKRSILINEKKMRAGSPDDDTAGFSHKEVEKIKRAFREENPGRTTVPSRVYATKRERPLLMLHLIKPKPSSEGVVLTLPDQCELLVAVGLSFPELGDQSSSVIYKINMIEFRNLFPPEEVSGDDDIEESSDA